MCSESGEGRRTRYICYIYNIENIAAPVNNQGEYFDYWFPTMFIFCLFLCLFFCLMNAYTNGSLLDFC